MSDQHRSLRRVVGRGTAWSTLDVVVGRLGQFAQGVVVARIVAPRDFGVFAIALVVHTIVINISELGAASALVAADDADVPRIAPTVGTISLVTGCLLGGAVVLMAPVLASGLGSPAAAAPIRVMAINLPLAGITAVPASLLKRNFRMKRMFFADTANMVVSGILVIALALAGWGAMALAWAWVAGQLATTAVLCAQRATWVWPGWAPPQARRVLAFGVPMAGANLLAFMTLNVDYVVVGHVLGAAALGLYMLAFNISGWPLNVFGSVIRSVSMPAFTRIRVAGGSMPETFLRAMRMIAAVTMPLCLIIGGLAHPAVVAIYGQRWAPASSALLGLSALGAGRILLELCGDFLVSLGRTREVMIAQIPWLLGLTVTLFAVARPFGIQGVGFGQAAVVAGIALPVYALLLRRVGVRSGAFVRALLPAIAWSAAAAVAAHLVAALVDNPFLACAAGGAAGLAVAIAPFGPMLWRRRSSLRVRRSSPAAGLMDPGETAVQAN